MWTPLAREIVRTHPGIRAVVPYEQFGNNTRIVESEIFRGNPNFTTKTSDDVVGIRLNDPQTNYCKLDAPDRCVHRYDKHVIHQICEAYGINNVELKCELYLDDAELACADAISLDKFIAIDPHTKNEYTLNKEYPFEKWQRVVDAVSLICPVIQIGRKTDKVLSGAVDMTGKLTFREAAGVIKRSMLFVGSEGGLMHAANAMGTKAVILVTGFIDPKMTCYPENTNIWIGAAHGPCGWKVKCDKCYVECQAHDESELIRAIKDLLV